MKAERVEKMLALLDERLDSYTVEETVERLHSYGGAGPTVDEFLASLDLLPEKPTADEDSETKSD